MPIKEGEFFCRGCLVDRPFEVQSKVDPRYCDSCQVFIKQDQEWRVRNKEIAAKAEADDDGDEPKKVKERRGVRGEKKVKRVVVVGDTHAGLREANKVILKAVEKGAKVISTERGKQQMDAILKAAVEQTEQAAQVEIQKEEIQKEVGCDPGKPGDLGEPGVLKVAHKKVSAPGQNCQQKMLGSNVYNVVHQHIEVGEAGNYVKVVGRKGGIKRFAEDIKSGTWEKTEYETSSADSPPNRNWFKAEDFVALVDRGGNILGA
jgi:hypothetical protein